MKLIFLNFLLLSTFGNLIAQKDCTEFTEGTFKLAYGPYKNGFETIRTDSTQTDFDRVYNSTTEYKISWIDNCTYKLTRIKGKIHEGFQGFKLEDLIFEVDTADENGYRYLLKIAETDILLDTTTFVKVK